MTKERMQELQAKYAELFKFGTDYTCFLSYLKGMAENVPDDLFLKRIRIFGLLEISGQNIRIRIHSS